jgi:hypothetical protein
MKITERQKELLDNVCKGFNFKNANDKVTKINREDAKAAGSVIKKLREEILNIYPYDYIIKLKTGESSAKANLTILRQMLRLHGRRLVSQRTYNWDREKKRNISQYSYTLL